MIDAPYGVLYHTHYKRVTGPPSRPATREEWLAAMDRYGWPTIIIGALVNPGHRTMAVVGGPHRDNDPEVDVSPMLVAGHIVMLDDSRYPWQIKGWRHAEGADSPYVHLTLVVPHD